ncbi:hypothetical protein [Aeromicrobium sp.]|uniref:hypothetical protein n=1 Tax=Aeromicrobium sp. TaxID=1871063 RepID=UPI004034E361
MAREDSELPGDGSSYASFYAPVPIDLEAEATDATEATCYVCEAPATVLVEVLRRTNRIGSAVVLCDEDHRLASGGELEELAQRMARDGTGDVDDHRRVARILVTDLGRSAPIPRGDWS